MKISELKNTSRKFSGQTIQQNGGKNQCTRREKNSNTQSDPERGNRLQRKKEIFRDLWPYDKRSKRYYENGV